MPWPSARLITLTAFAFSRCDKQELGYELALEEEEDEDDDDE